MINSQKPLIVANWKMNPVSLAAAKKLFVTVRQSIRRYDDVTVVVAPPAVYISDLSRLSPSGRIALGSQSVWPEPTGAQTGEVSVPMHLSVGATYMIVGHSERRAQGIDDAAVAQRVAAVLKAKATPIVCIGEQERDADGDFYAHIEQQLKVALGSRKKAEVARTIIAYEPIWAIGTGQTPTADDVQEMRLFIDKCITHLFDRATARKVRVLYGGSINEKNAGDMYHNGAVNGFLVGGASLRPDSFTKIVQAVRSVK